MKGRSKKFNLKIHDSQFKVNTQWNAQMIKTIQNLFIEILLICKQTSTSFKNALISISCQWMLIRRSWCIFIQRSSLLWKDLAMNLDTISCKSFSASIRGQFETKVLVLLLPFYFWHNNLVLNVSSQTSRIFFQLWDLQKRIL